MRSPGALVFVAASAMSLRPAVARASDCSGIVSACVNDDALWPHAGPARFIGVGSAETVAAGQIGFGLVTTYLSRPIVLQLESPGVSTNGSQDFAINDQVNASFLWAYGVTRRLELDLALPLTLGQGGTGLAPVTGAQDLKDTAVRDMRFGFAYSLVGDPQPGVAANRWGEGGGAGGTPSGGIVGRFEVSAPIGDSQQFAGEQNAVLVPSVAGACRLGRWFAGLEVGARLRPTTQLLNARIGTQILTSLGVGFDVLPRELLSVAAEGWALPTLAAQQDLSVVDGAYTGRINGAHIVPAEWHLSLRSAPIGRGDLSFEAGGGGGIPLSGDLPVTTPRFRFTLALRWAPTSS